MKEEKTSIITTAWDQKIGEELQISYVLLLQTFGESIKTQRFHNFLGGTIEHTAVSDK